MKCPICGSSNIAYTEKIKRGNILIAILIEIALIILTIVTFLIKFYPIAVICICIAIFFPIGFKIYDRWKQRESKTKAICNDCGHSWYID